MQDAHAIRKVAPPTLPSVLLHRAALVAQLREAVAPEPLNNAAAPRYKLILCCAPAGYGKTTLLADFAHTVSLPCCWYFLEPSDTDPVIFLRTFLHSLRHVFPQFGKSLDPFFYNGISANHFFEADLYRSCIDTLFTALAAEIPQHFVFILCNYEEINENATITSLLSYLLEKLPPQMTLLVESRVIPNISFPSLIMRNEICGLDSSALRFSMTDIMELARLRGLTSFKEMEAEQLVSSFDGWITGILLGTRLGDAHLRLLAQEIVDKHISQSQEKSLVGNRRRTLFAYVVNEVLNQDAALQTFLQNIALLPQIVPDMCNTFLGIQDAAEHLARLENQGFFLTSHGDKNNKTYIFHPVLRDLLSEQLQQKDPDHFRFLHRRAAELWRASGNYELAMHHALVIRDYEVAVSLVLETYERLLQQSQQETLMRWLHALPETLQENHLQLLLIQATVTLEYGQHASAFPLLDRAEALLSGSSEDEGRVFRATIAVLRSKALCQVGAYSQAQELCQKALEQLPEKEYALQASAKMRLGICANLQGHFTAGITHLQQALHIWANQPPLNQAIHLHNALANTYYLTGNFTLAKHHLTHMFDACEQSQDVLNKGNALILQGLLAQDQGFEAEAEAAFLQALTLARTVPYAQRGAAYALVNLGSLFVQQGKYAKALAYSEEGLVLARQWGNRSLTNAALSDIALSYLFLGDAVSARLSVEQMETQVLRNGPVGYEQAWRNLTYGMLLLSENRPREAESYLIEIDGALQATDFKRGSIQVKLRLAACRIALEQTEQAIQLLLEVAGLLNTHSNYTYLIQIELQWFPLLQALVQSHALLAPLRAQLGIDEPLPVSEVSEVITSSSAGTAPRLFIYAFGEPAVVLDGQPVKHWRMARAKELFFFLLDSRHPVNKESILTALWPNCSEQTSSVFHNTLYQIRKLLGDACVIFQPTGYSLDLAACYGCMVFYDVQAFEQHQREASLALEQADEVRAKEAFLKMVQLYRDDYGRPFYNDWCTFRRDELRASYLEACRKLARLTWNAEAWNESAEHWRSILRLDNCSEEAHYGLMRYYMRQGKRGEALRQYRSCQKILQEELGVQPSQLIQRFYQRLLAKHETKTVL